MDRSPAVVIEPSSLDFGVVATGGTARALVRVRNLSEGPLDLTIQAVPPFSTQVGRIQFERAGARFVEVVFSPSAPGGVAGEIGVTSARYRSAVRMWGVGAAPCPATACAASWTDPASGSCVVNPLPDGSSCDAGRCMHAARCASGKCVGHFVSCDDGNLCTRDVCDPARGCIAAEDPEICPQPAEPCLVSSCDPQRGCVTTERQDGTACGPRDCDSLAVCLQGSCQRVRAPPEQRVGSSWEILDPDEVGDGLALEIGAFGNDTLWRTIATSDDSAFPTGQISVSSAGQIRWTLDGQVRLQGVVDGRLVLAEGYGDPIAAYAAGDAAPLWSHDLLPDDAILDPVTGADGRLYLHFDRRLPETGSVLLVVDAASGTVEREISLDDELARVFVDESGRPLLEVGWRSAREILRLDPATGELKDIRMGADFGGLYALYDDTYVGRVSWYPHVIRFGLFVDGERRALGPWAPPPVRGVPVLIDAESAWLVASAPSCDGAFDSHQPCLVFSHLYRYDRSGALRWVRALDGVLALGPILTDRGSVLLVVHPPAGFEESESELIEIDGAGRTTMRCPLPIPLRNFGVLFDELLMATEVRPEGHAGTNVFSIHGIRVPDIRLAPRGWVSRYGSFTRPSAPMPEVD